MITYKKFITRDEVNLDTTHRCSLLCPNCERQTGFTNFGKKVPGVDVSEDSFNKIIKYFRHINFEGQYSDPVHHPKFLKMLKICYDKKIRVSIQHASAAKSFDWYIKAFKINPNSYPKKEYQKLLDLINLKNLYASIVDSILTRL